MIYVVPGLLVLWGALAPELRPHGRSAFLLGGAAGTVAMLGVQALGAGALGEFGAAVVAYGLLFPAIALARRWARLHEEERRQRRVRIRERRLSPAELRAARKPAARVRTEAPVVQSRAIEMANRRSIRWKEQA